MAIAFDASVDGGRKTGTSGTFSLTVGSISNGIVIAYIRNPNGAAPTGVTCGGSAMTEITHSEVANMAARLYAYYLLNPSSGANSIVASYSGSQAFIDCGAASYSGVSQSSPVDVSKADSTDPTTTSYTQSVTTTVDQDWIVWCVNNSTGAASAGTSTTSRWSNANGNAMMDSNAARSTGSNSVNATRPGNSEWQSVTFALAPSGGAPAATVKQLAALGVG